jgi:hypothetical protein
MYQLKVLRDRNLFTYIYLYIRIENSITTYFLPKRSLFFFISFSIFNLKKNGNLHVRLFEFDY